MPALHSLCVSEPVEHDEPAGHEVHWPSLPRPGVLLNDPSSHGNGALLPSSQYEPARHTKHSVSPLALMNLPASHLVQVPWPTNDCTVPGLHGVCSRAPVEHDEPAGHEVH